MDRTYRSRRLVVGFATASGVLSGACIAFTLMVYGLGYSPMGKGDTGVPPRQSKAPTVDQNVAQSEYNKLVQQLREQHSRESIDSAWANVSAERLGRELKALGKEVGFEVEAVDCRTTRCAATLRWETYEQARSAHPKVAYADLSLNCESSVVVPEPADPTAVYTSMAYFLCVGAGRDVDASPALP